MNKKLMSLLSVEGKVIKDRFEPIQFKAILPYLVKYRKMEVALYGVGGKAFHHLNWLRSVGIEPIAITDKKDSLDANGFWGVPQIPIDEFSNYIAGHKTCILLCTSLIYDYDLDKVKKVLYNAGAACVYDVKHVNSVYYHEWKYYLCRHSDEFLESFSLFNEQASKEIFIEYIRAIMENDFYRLNNESSFGKYFGEGIFNWNDDECFMNCGANLGDTIFHLVDKNPFESIYGIEVNKNYYDGMREYLSVLPPEIYNKIELFNTKLDSEGNFALDALLQGRKVTCISLDVEGAEISVLKGAKEIIQNQRPVLALSAYHKQDDLITLPKIVRQYVDNYSFFLRKYLPGNLEASKDELVLYAVPNERVITTDKNFSVKKKDEQNAK